MIVGEILDLKDSKGIKVGTGKVVSKQDSFYWLKLIIPDHRMSGEEFPYSGDGKYIGSFNWRMPDADLKIIEADL